MARDYWLKTFGMGARESRMPDDWRSVRVLTAHATSKRNSSMKTGDGIVYYAAGFGLLFAAGTVTSYPYIEPTDGEEEWPWRVDVSLDEGASLRFIHHGVSLDEVSIDGRDLGRSIRQKSHIRLSETEHAAAIAALRRAVSAARP